MSHLQQAPCPQRSQYIFQLLRDFVYFLLSYKHHSWNIFPVGRFKVTPLGAHSNCAHTSYSKSSKSHLIKFAGTDSSNNKRNDLLIVGLFVPSHLLSLKHVSTFLLYLLHLLVLLHWSLPWGGRAGCCELNRDKPYFQFYV